jgi:ankyrin repeat protein
MLSIQPDDPLAVAVVEAIHTGDIEALKRLLAQNPDLATARIGARSMLHIATDWPGHFPNSAATVATLIAAGAEVNARFCGRHSETPLHWAASSDDIEALDALIAGGADIEARGGVIGEGSPLDDAIAFGQWQAARRLVECGAQTKLWHEAALGLIDRAKQRFAGNASPGPDEVTHAFWFACHGGQRETAEYLREQGAELNWIPPWEERTPLDTAQREGAADLVDWLRSQGAKSAGELKS